jgi:hypothetical protein
MWILENSRDSLQTLFDIRWLDPCCMKITILIVHGQTKNKTILTCDDQWSPLLLA